MHILDYEVLRKIGEGGSRVVYLVRKEFSAVETALKIFKRDALHERIADQRERHSLVEILSREVQTLRRFSHPNLTRIFTFGEVDDTFFIEEEYMEGGTVADALDNLEEHEGVLIFRNLARGVRFLHSKGILVRDLKLNNALLSEDREVAKLDDLELCGDLHQHIIAGTRGSDRYAAPELMQGGQATVQTDTYALGACLYYLLTKERDTIARLNGLSGEQYEAPLERLLGGTHELYHNLLRGCLAYDPADRFRDVLDVLNALEKVIPLEVHLRGRRDWVLAPDREYFTRTIDGNSVLFRDARNPEVAALLGVYQRVFQKHNILKGDPEDVLEYLFTSNINMRFSGGGYVVAVSDEGVIGGMLVRPQDFNREQAHLRVSYNHVAVVDPALEAEVMLALLQASDRKVQAFMRDNGVKSCKVHVGIAPDEVRCLPIYIRNGFEQEGVIKHKYRFNENAIELGKVFR